MGRKYTISALGSRKCKWKQCQTYQFAKDGKVAESANTLLFWRHESHAPITWSFQETRAFEALASCLLQFSRVRARRNRRTKLKVSGICIILGDGRMINEEYSFLYSKCINLSEWSQVYDDSMPEYLWEDSNKAVRLCEFLLDVYIIHVLHVQWLYTLCVCVVIVLWYVGGSGLYYIAYS